MSYQTLPPLLSSSPTTLTTVLDALFEPCPALHVLALPLLMSSPPTSYAALVTSVGAQLTALLDASSADDDDDGDATARLDAILQAHPRLGARDAAPLSAASRREQEAMRDAGGGDEDADGADGADQLARLNAEYEARFGGLRFV